MILDQAFKYITEMKRQNDELLLNGGNNEQVSTDAAGGSRISVPHFCCVSVLTNNKAWIHKRESRDILHIQEKYSCLEYLETKSQLHAQVSVLAHSYEIMRQLHCDLK